MELPNKNEITPSEREREGLIISATDLSILWQDVRLKIHKLKIDIDHYNQINQLILNIKTKGKFLFL